MVAAIGGLCMTGLVIGTVGGIVFGGGSDSTPTSGLPAAATTRPPSMATSAAARYDVPSTDNLATELTETRQTLEADEVLHLERMPLEEAVEQALSGEIPDAKTVCGLLRAAKKLGRLG